MPDGAPCARAPLWEQQLSIRSAGQFVPIPTRGCGPAAHCAALRASCDFLWAGGGPPPSVGLPLTGAVLPPLTRKATQCLLWAVALHRSSPGLGDIFENPLPPSCADRWACRCRLAVVEGTFRPPQAHLLLIYVFRRFVGRPYRASPFESGLRPALPPCRDRGCDVLGDGPVGPSSVPVGVFYGAVSFGSCWFLDRRRSTRVSAFDIDFLPHVHWFRWPFSVVILAHIRGSEFAQPHEDGRPHGDRGRVALKNLENSSLVDVP